MKKEYHIYTATRYVLRTISSKLQELGDFKHFDILVFKNKNDGIADKPNTYEELVELLKDYDSVYSFNRVETKLHGAIGYDIIIKE